METKYIGNLKSKEFHKADCYTLKNTYNTNQRPFYSKKQALIKGYDPCGHCLDTKKKKQRATGTKECYFGHFYGIFNGTSTDDQSGILVNTGQQISIFVRLQKTVFENDSWQVVPVQQHKVAITCDEIDFQPKKTDTNGLAEWHYTIPANFEPGTTTIRVNTYIQKTLIWHGNINTLSFEVPQQIEIVKNEPEYFEQKTNIIFKLNSDKKIKADIYRGLSENKFSHINNLRNFNDGILQATDNAVLQWDGTIDHGIRKGKAVKKGTYKIVIKGENGISDRDELILHKRGGITGNVFAEPDLTEEYVSGIVFLQNPFSNKTKTDLNFVLKKEATVSIHIQHVNWNFQGMCVKQFIKNEKLKKGIHSYNWSGHNNLGFPAPLGEYKVRIIANDKTYVKTGLWKKAHWNL